MRGIIVFGIMSGGRLTAMLPRLWTDEKLNMQKSLERNCDPVEVGDLVKCTFLGSPEYDKFGIVLECIYYVGHGEHRTRHPDEYNCRILFDGCEKMVRGKWLKVVSKKS